MELILVDLGHGHRDACWRKSEHSDLSGGAGMGGDRAHTACEAEDG